MGVQRMQRVAALVIPGRALRLLVVGEREFRAGVRALAARTPPPILCCCSTGALTRSLPSTSRPSRSACAWTAPAWTQALALDGELARDHADAV